MLWSGHRRTWHCFALALYCLISVYSFRPTSLVNRLYHSSHAFTHNEAKVTQTGRWNHIRDSAIISMSAIAEPSGRGLTALEKAKLQWKLSCADMKKYPSRYLIIPVVAALVGYITNFVGVKMLFYPVKWTGIPLKSWPQQPLGLLGWQGIVPCKRFIMSGRMVDVTISRLLNIPEVFRAMAPKEVANILQKDIKHSVCRGLVPSPVVNLLLRRTSQDMITNVEDVVDLKKLVVDGLCTDATLLGSMFQKVAKNELDFLTNSGLVFGFLLGLLQMLQWMIYPANWTLVAGGGVVGYITNWIALKWIFEPLNPTKVGPFVLQGMFLRRQKEVSVDFCEFIAKNVLTSQKMWAHMVNGAPFRRIVDRNVPLPRKAVDSIVHTLADKVIPSTVGAGAALHHYTTKQLDVQGTLTKAMNKLTTEEFERVLHPIFQEDELTLIMAGAVLGALTGALQWWWKENVKRRGNTKGNGDVRVAEVDNQRADENNEELF